MACNNYIGIFGGDKRQVYIASSLLSKGYYVYTYKLLEKIEHKNHASVSDLKELMNKCRVLIGPIPLTKDLVTISSGTADNSNSNTIAHYLNKEHMLIGGVIPSDIRMLCNEQGIFCFDLMESDKIAIMNAIATAEGIIMEAIKSSDFNLHKSNCLVLGYGRCGKVLAAKLKGLDAIVTIAARGEDDLAYAQAAGLFAVHIKDIKPLLPSFKFIFNTVPSLILDQEHLKKVSKDVVIIDIASAPGGVDFEYALNHGINAKLCLGIPGKVSPKTSADILVTEIEALMKEVIG